MWKLLFVRLFVAIISVIVFLNQVSKSQLYLREFGICVRKIIHFIFKKIKQLQESNKGNIYWEMSHEKWIQIFSIVLLSDKNVWDCGSRRNKLVCNWFHYLLTVNWVYFLSCVIFVILYRHTNSIWDKVFKNGQSKICGGGQTNLKGYGLLKQTLSLQIF